VTIRARIEKPVRSITLNAAEITFDEVRVTAGSRTWTPQVVAEAAKEQVSFELPEVLPAGDVTIDIRYAGILNDDLRGFYLSQANNRRYAVTQLEATDARRMFPSFDEPAFKATFQLTAIIDAADSAISNGAVVSSTPGPGAGKRTVRFKTTPKMSTYLVALAVGDFECTESKADGIPLRICSTPDKRALTGFAMEAARESLQYFNRYYSVKYPFEKLDIVAVPDFAAGAMENTAAIFYRETLLLAEPSASVETRKSIAVVLAHEIAHQWFGNLVTMQWWDDLWLNEGFANWIMTKPVAAWKPDWHVELDEVQDNQTAMRLDALHSTRPVRVNVSTPAEIGELFDPIAYEKGAAVLRMLESWVGREPFRKGVNAYIDAFKYRNARAEDFWSTLARLAGKPVDRVMRTFVDRPGLPLVKASIECGAAPGAARVTLTQERYVREKPPAGEQTESGSAETVAWEIPVCLKAPSGGVTCELMASRVQSVRLEACPGWVLANAGALGYYRTELSPAIVRKVAADVTALDPAERMTLLADEWALVRAGRHDVGTYLDLAGGFGRERSADVLQTVATALATIGDDLVTGETREAYRRWVSSVWSGALAEVGVEPQPADTDQTRALRATLVSMLGGTARDSKALGTARQFVDRELAKPGTVEATLLNEVVDLAAIGGDAALYERYRVQASKATDPEERYRYLYGLTAFTDPALVRRTVDVIMGPEVRSQDAKLLFASLIRSPDTRALAWELLQARWDDLQRKSSDAGGNAVLVGALGTFCDARSADQVKAFFATHPVPDAERTLQQALEGIASCAAFAERERDPLAKWLSSVRRP
jgi:aminopeptidase N